MKKLTVLLLAVLMGWTMHALAEDDPARVMLADGYMGAHIISSAQNEDTAFFALDIGRDEPLKLLGYEKTGGVWTLFLDSDAALRPSGLTDLYRQWNYEELTLSLQEDVLSIVCHGWTSWQYDFARDSAGQWHFQRLYVADDTNRMYDELTYEDGCISQTFPRRSKDGTVLSTEYFLPCPMPWLSGCETLAGFDASAFPMDLGGLLEAELSRVAAELLPEYAYVDGKFSTYAATFLMDNADGERFFFGGVYEDGHWVWTKSTPLPEGTFCDSYHGGAGTLPISFIIPGSEPDDWGEYPWAEYNIVLQEDGRWLVEGMYNEIDEDYLHFEEGGVSINMVGKVYGECLLERDMTKIDWADYPVYFADVMRYMSDDWGVIREPDLPLYADTEESVLLANYLYATPVEVLGYEEDDHDKGWEGYLARVRIAGGSVEGWMPAYGLFYGKEQLWEATEIDNGEEWTYLTTVEGELHRLDESLPAVTLRKGAPLYRTMDGEVLWTATEDADMILMADLQNGWYHVRFDDTWDMFLESGFVRYEDCLDGK